MDKGEWNRQGREDNARICRIIDEVVETDGSTDEDLVADARPSDLAEAVLADVVSLNASGDWRRARALHDPAHAPFIPHMERTRLGLDAVVVLGPDAFIVRRGAWHQPCVVLHVDGDRIVEVEGALGFGISCNRRWFALATPGGVVVSRGFRGADARCLPWPEGEPIRPALLAVSNSGERVLVGNDTCLWLYRETGSTRLLPNAGHDDELIELRAALSPDGRFVAYGWEDAPGHGIEDVSGPDRRPVGVVVPQCSYPFLVRFDDDGRHLFSNSRIGVSGTTAYVQVEDVRGIDECGALPDAAKITDDYLPAYGMCVLPAACVPGAGRVAWIGGLAWSHGAPVHGGRPIFTHYFGSALHGFDFDPACGRAAVASSSGMLHVLEPALSAEPGRERGYRPRRELWRWIFWDTLDAPIRW